MTQNPGGFPGSGHSTGPDDPTGASHGGGPAHKWPSPPQHQKLLTLTRYSAGLYTLAVAGALIFFFSSNPTAAFKELGLSADQAGWFTAGLSLAALLVLALVLGLYRLVYNGLKRGRNRARVFGIIFASISVLATVPGLFQPLTYGGWEVLHIAVRVAGIVVDTLWLITALRKPLPHWFSRPF